MGGVSTIRACIKYRIKYDTLMYCIFVIDFVIPFCFVIYINIYMYI